MDCWRMSLRQRRIGISLLAEKGFDFLVPANRAQVEVVMQRSHAHFPFTKRINIAGSNEANVERVAVALDHAFRNIAVVR